MEERNTDINTTIGFMLIGVILMFWIYTTPPPAQLESIDEDTTNELIEEKTNPITKEKSLSLDGMTDQLFNKDAIDGLENRIEIKNELYSIEFSENGGQISQLALNKYVDHNGSPIYLINNGNSNFNIDFKTSNNRIINTKDHKFISDAWNDEGKDIVSMKLSIDQETYLEYLYTIGPESYVIDIEIKSQGFSNVLNKNEPSNFLWNFKGIRNSKSISYENRYTRLTYSHDGNKIDKLSQMGDDEDEISNINWISFRQHFFSSILIPKSVGNPENADYKTFDKAKIISKDLVEDESIDTLYTKQYVAQIPFSFKNNEFDESFQIYFGPTDSNTFKWHAWPGNDLDESIPFGWGIFGFINKSVFVPLFRFLSSIFPYGIAIIFMTIIVRLFLAPVLYNSYLSQAKMKILKPDVEQLNKQYKDNPMKRQQEMMSLYKKAGASPMSGCLPALLQIPVFYALFMFFPSAFDLRQKSFLWADDLSAYDSVLELPFRIWGYGDHVSLFPILAAVSIFFYMQMTMGQQTASQPAPQEGMPDMTKMMKYMMYISPLFMLIFFNNYASGLSLYYFISNILSISIMFVIKNYILDEKKIREQIQVNKAKPAKPPSRFQRKMQELMEEAEKQKNNQNR
ncbi:MAG: membrane protein insertase YidC [Flavobacteriaceae bacterium]|nr:membrane protein insertase YidC [Flavobacteriaceae bacterium]